MVPNEKYCRHQEQSGAERKGAGTLTRVPQGENETAMQRGKERREGEEEEIPFFKGEYEALMTSSPTSTAPSFKSQKRGCLAGTEHRKTSAWSTGA